MSLYTITVVPILYLDCFNIKYIIQTIDQYISNLLMLFVSWLPYPAFNIPSFYLH